MSVRYLTGENVEVGDSILFLTKADGHGEQWRPGRVESMVPPGTRVSEDLVCKVEGIFFEIEWDSGRGLHLDEPESGVLDYEYRFVARHHP